MCKLTGFHSYLSIFKLGELLRSLNPQFFHWFWYTKVCLHYAMWSETKLTPVSWKCDEEIKLVLLHVFLNISEGFTLSLLIICKKYSYSRGFLFSGNIVGRVIKTSYKMLEKKSWSMLPQFEFLPVNIYRIFRGLFSPCSHNPQHPAP